MKQSIVGSSTPTAHIAVNKSRIKVYNNTGSLPTYYLNKGQEFSIELYNPTQEVILAKIELNNKAISQGGIVLNPGQRVFLERYLDVDRKFLFDTYEVDGSEQTKQAIAKNGDFTVKFYKEKASVRIPLQRTIWGGPHYGQNQIYYGQGMINIGNSGTVQCGPFGYANSNMTINGTNSTGLGFNTTTSNYCDSNIIDNSTTIVPTSFTSSATFNAGEQFLSMDSMELNSERIAKSPLRSKKSIETGRVEQGGKSNQKLTDVDMTFESYAFATTSYKLLPISQKINTTVSFKKYCTNCGAKLGKTDKFCSSCGTKA